MEKQKQSTSSLVREIKRKTRRVFSSEEKIQIVLEGLRGEDSIAGLGHKFGISNNINYNWSKIYIKIGKKSLVDTESNKDNWELEGLKGENVKL